MAVTFDLYPRPFDLLAIALPIVPVAIAVVAFVKNELDPMFFTGLVAATIAGILLLALRTEVRQALSSVSQRQLLYKKGTRVVADPPTFGAFVQGFQRSLGSWMGWVLAVAFAIFAVPQFFVTQDQNAWTLVRTQGMNAFALLVRDWPTERVIGVGATAILGFVLGLFAWRMLCVGRYVYRLGTTFDVRIRTQHPDGAGGWAPIGDVCFLNALIVIVPTIDLGIWRTLIATVPSVRQRYGGYEDWFTGLLVVLFVLALFVFFAPLYGVHRAMRRERDVRQRTLEAISNQLEAVGGAMREAAEQGNTAALDDLKKKHTSLREQYDTERAIPTWPVDLRLVGKYVAAQVVPLLSLTKIADFISERLFGSS